MSQELLLHLQREHAFDPAPVRADLGIYHVPFSTLVEGSRPEATLREATLRFERLAIVGDSGAGKSSLLAHVFGPEAQDVAPILVPVARESFAVVREPKAMFAHLVAVIARYASDAQLLSDDESEGRLADASSQRPVGRRSGRGVKLAVGWMGASLSAELQRQAAAPATIDRSATELLEVVHQMVEIIRSSGLAPILVFDDTDRWLAGSAYDDPEGLTSAFFGRVLPELTGLQAALVVAVHRKYLANETMRAAIERTLETRVEVPTLRDASAIAAILGSRVSAHGIRSGSLDDVIEPSAVDRLFHHYQQGLRNELRSVLRTAHTALAAVCDTGADVITSELIDDAIAEWET